MFLQKTCTVIKGHEKYEMWLFVTEVGLKQKLVNNAFKQVW